MSTGSVRRAFTMVELLVVVLILSVLMAIAIPLYQNSIGLAQRSTCRANMQTIANAIQAKKIATSAANYSLFIGATVNTTNEPDLQAAPVCPTTGTNTYTIQNGTSGDNATFQVNCSNSSAGTAHGTFHPGDPN